MNAKVKKLIINLCKLEDQKAEIDALAKEARGKLKEIMEKEGAAEYAVELPDYGGEVKVLFIEPTSVKYDEEGLKKYFKEKKMLGKVTRTMLDMNKVQALVKAGRVPIGDIESYAEVKPGTSYVRINKPKKGGKKQ